MPAALEQLIGWWSSYYGDHQLTSVTIRFLHLAAIVIGGGTAIALDRQVLRALAADGVERRQLLGQLRGSHRIVVPSLVVLAITGVLMTASDLEVFLTSTLFRIKVLLIVLLVANGGLLLAAEAAATRSDGHEWGRMRLAAGASAVLWLAALFIGTWLTVGASSI